MASIFSKNGILSGRIDNYCLICSEQFTNEEETLAHIVNSQHKESLKTCGYFEKYKEDFIRKAEGLYFCEPCSLTFPTATKVELHIDEPTHIKEKNKTSPWLTRVENDIIAFNQFIISDDAWNGCVEDTCVLCNTEFDDSSSHKVIRSHVLNLIKSEVIFDNVQNTVYRTIDNRSKQCLTCNVIIGNNPTSHFKTEDHIEAYKLYEPTVQKKEVKNTILTTKNTKETQNLNVKIDKSDKNDGFKVDSGNVNEDIKKEAGTNKNFKKGAQSNIYESVDRYQKSNVNIDFINETVLCKKCSKTIDFNTAAIDKHIEEHKKTSNKKSPEATLFKKPVLLGKDKRSQKTVSVGEYAEQHGFTHNRADYSYYCRPCSRRLSTTLDDLQKHVASRIHTENTKQTSKTDATEAPIKESIVGFIETFEPVETKNAGMFMVINDKYWLNIFDFFLIAKTKNEKIFCYGCHIDLNPENVMEHIFQTDNHKEIIEKCLVITSLENEFIREIKPDVYHCGYCNILENDWDDILEHIAMTEHKKKKSKAEQSLREHQPNVFFRINMREIKDILKLNLYNNFVRK